MQTKKYINKNVYEAAIERLNLIYDNFKKVYISFSGGKDSGVLLNLMIEVAKKKNKIPIDVLFIDLEAQYKKTIEFVERTSKREEVNMMWICLPLHLRNAVSQIQPHWLCWGKEKKDAWVRKIPENVISDENYFSFFRKGMEFEDFVVDYANWFSEGKKTACIVAIRSDESLNRFRTIKNIKKETYKGLGWTTRISENIWNVYPIYDWKTKDVWIANGKFGYDYNEIYDLMYLAGLSIHQMRICQPYGDDQRKGLWLFKVLEPETWAKVCNRVEGANFGNRYTKGQSHILGNYKISLPPNYTYKKYAKFLLSTMPPYLEEHYREKIFKFLNWWKKNGKKYGVNRIYDHADSKLEASKKIPSWRRICKILLKNDYWCKGLSFSQTKYEMQKQIEIINKLIQEECNG